MRCYIRWLLIEPRFLWLALFGVAAGVATPNWLGASEKAFRLSGMVLQLSGIITVVWGIISTRQFFGLPPVRDGLVSWWNRAPHKCRNIGAAAALVAPPMFGEAHGFTSAPIDHTAPVDDRFRAVERNIAMLHERIGAVHADARKKHGDLEAKLSENAARIEEIRTGFDEDLRGFGTSGLHISAIGAAWLFLGTIMGSASQELAAWLR